MPNLFNFKPAKILVIGEIILDTYWYGSTNRTSPEAPVPIAHYKNSEDKLAGAGYIAAILKNLGATVDIISIVGSGSDKLAQSQDNYTKIIDLLKNHNISRDYIIPTDQQTNQKIRIVSQAQQLLQIDNSANQIKQNNLDSEKLDNYFNNIYKNYDTIIFYDNNSLNKSLAKHLELCKNNNIKTIYYSDNLKLNYQADYVISSLEANFGEDHSIIINDTKIDTKLINTAVENLIGLQEVLISIFAVSISAGNNLLISAALAKSAMAFCSRQFGQYLINIIDLQLAYADYLTDSKYNYINLKQEINAARAKNKKIVFANGCFDVLHVGHIAYLDLAKQRGDKLFVAINSDCSIKRLKGNDRPINNLSDRLYVLSSLSCQDWVVPFFNDTPEDFLKWLKPDLLVKGGDYTPEQIVGHEIVHSYGGVTEIINHPYNHISSTKIINNKDYV